MLVPLIRRNVACYLTSNKQLLKICAAIGNTKQCYDPELFCNILVCLKMRTSSDFYTV